jgi:aquaporin Z
MAEAAVMTPQPMSRRLAAELMGTFWLVFAGCGSAVLAASNTSDSGFPLGIGWAGVALAFGLTVLTMAYAVGHISGGHFNPAVTLGLAASGRFAWRDVVPYVVTQVVAAVLAASVLWVVASGQPEFGGQDSGFASNGYGDRSPAGYSLLACAIIEVLLTAFFLFVILGSTDTRAPRGFAPLAIGLSLTLIHLVSIPVTNTSVNPARSTGPALFAGTEAIGQLWLFWLAPLAGGLVAGLVYGMLLGQDVEPSPLEVATEA